MTRDSGGMEGSPFSASMALKVGESAAKARSTMG
jgi:hypothetical protein